MQRDQTLAPQINVNTFPYRRKWTKAELDGVYERFEKLRDVLTDVVGPSGQPMYVDPSMVAIIALHAALAGADVHDDERQFIEYRIRPDEYGLFQATHEWRVKGEFPDDDPPEDPEIARARAEELREQLHRDVAPEVLDELKKQIREEFARETKKIRKSGKRVRQEGR